MSRVVAALDAVALVALHLLALWLFVHARFQEGALVLIAHLLYCIELRLGGLK